MSYPIWLPCAQYPSLQRAAVNTDAKGALDGMTYAVAEFRKEYAFSGKMTLRVSGNAQFFLFVNGKFVGLGPASAGGDFLGVTKPLPWDFENEYTVHTEGGTRIRALVRLQPEALTEYTQGHGWFNLSGTCEGISFGTDDTWQCRTDTRFVNQVSYDSAVPEDTWKAPERAEAAPKMVKYELPNLAFTEISGDKGHMAAGDSRETLYERIYSAYLRVKVSAPCRMELRYFELSGQAEKTLCLNFGGADEWTSLRMFSVGGTRISVLEGEADIENSIIFSRYPAEIKGQCVTSDGGLNRVMDVCRWTLSLCRQTMHLDSPLHQELLACTGDYYIEMLMTAFESGDFRMADLDVRRTAMWLDANNGRMFHTTYSLIWVQMLWRLYAFTGERDTLSFCLPALDKLLSLFETYLNDDGVIEYAPDYMFVDWTVMEGYSMHHPPRALGQSVLNAFYYKALRDACGIAKELGISRPAWVKAADKLKASFHKTFWDAEKRLYADGLDTPDPAEGRWKPENPRGMRHFSRYPQTLAALYGLCPEEEKTRLTDIAADEENDLQVVQPYFMHFVLEAVINNGLAEKHAMKLLKKWVPVCEGCPKGLQEGWIKPEEGYSFDHSHAWGGTPAWHLPALLTGLKVLSPAMKKISLSPKLFGLDSAEIKLPTPAGIVSVSMKKGEETKISAPDGMEVVVE